jgi:predicted anti-sigma-YlaC factor YlaD
MTCRDALEFLADYLDGSLPLRKRLSLDLHLSLCRHCRDYLDNYKKAVQASREALTDQALCEDLPEDLVQAILAMRKQLYKVD